MQNLEEFKTEQRRYIDTLFKKHNEYIKENIDLIYVEMKKIEQENNTEVPLLQDVLLIEKEIVESMTITYNDFQSEMTKSDEVDINLADQQSIDQHKSSITTIVNNSETQFKTIIDNGMLSVKNMLEEVQKFAEEEAEDE